MRYIQLILLTLLVLVIACEQEKTTTPVEAGYTIEEPEADKLNAYPILGYMQEGGDIAPVIDGSNHDLIWQYAPPYEIETEGGKDGFAPTVTMQAIYDNWYIYFLITWEDESESFQKDTWWFGNAEQGQNSLTNVFDTTFVYYRTADTVSTNRRVKVPVHTDWSIVSDFEHKVVETTTYKTTVYIDSTTTPPTITTVDEGTTTSYDTTVISGDEDKFSIFFNYNSANFINCANLCHGGNEMKTDLDEFVDVWIWDAHRTNFIKYVDDKYLSSDGFHGDVGDSCYVRNMGVSGDLPKYVDILDPGANKDFLLDSLWVTIVPFSNNYEWEVGNIIPGYILRKPTLGRTDIRAKGRYAEGKWTLEIRRSLLTLSEDEYENNVDVQFNPDTDANIDFYIAVFDNSHGTNHAISTQMHTLHFLQLVK